MSHSSSIAPIALALLMAGLLPSCHKKADSKPPITSSLLRITSTIQYPDLHRPWLKKQPFARSGLATVIEGGRLLVSADMVAHSTYIELEKPEDGPKATATVEALDEECNLAVLRPSDTEVLKGSFPLELAEGIKSGSKLDIVQLEQNGSPALTPATVTTVAVMPYPSEGAAYLAYRVTTSIPQRENSFVIPALAGDKLAGIVMRYDSKSQSAEIVPAPLIRRFLKEISKPNFHGLARAGLAWARVRGATIHQRLGNTEQHSGVYVTWVQPYGPADKAGIKRGDLLLKAAGHDIDGEGNYLDPDYGKITFNNLASLESAPGDTMELTYFRSEGVGKGVTNTAKVTLKGNDPSLEIIPSRLQGDQVPYLFLGPLLFQELSRPYLQEWGADWRHEAPQELVYLDTFQDELPRNQGRFVILSSLFPSPETIGFQDLGKRVVKSLNDHPIHSLSDLKEATKIPINGFHKILLEGTSGPIYLDASTCGSEEESIRQQYGIPSSPL